MAPEMLTSAAGGGRVEYSAAIDVFSYGIVLWQLLTCSQPYASLLGVTLNRWQLLQRIARDGLRPEIPPYAPPALAALMAECWAAEEQLRPTSSEVVRRLRLFYATEFGVEFGVEWRAAGPRSTSEAEHPEADPGAEQPGEPAGESASSDGTLVRGDVEPLV